MDKILKTIKDKINILKSLIKNNKYGKFIGVGLAVLALLFLYAITELNFNNLNNKNIGEIETTLIEGGDNSKFSEKEKQIKMYIKDDFDREKKNSYFVKTAYDIDDNDKRRFNTNSDKNNNEDENDLIEDMQLKEKLINDILNCNNKCSKNIIDKDKLYLLKNSKLKKLLIKCNQIQNKCLESEKAKYLEKLKECFEKCGQKCKTTSIDMDNLDFYSASELKQFYKDCLKKRGIDYKTDLINNILDCIKGCEECRMPGIDYDNLEQYTEDKLETILKHCENIKKAKLISDILNCIEGCEECKMPGIDYDNLEQYSIKKLQEILKYCEDYRNKINLINDILDCVEKCGQKCKMPGVDYNNLEKYSIDRLKQILDYCENYNGIDNKSPLINDILDCIQGCDYCKMPGIDYDNLKQYSVTKLKEILKYCEDRNKNKLISNISDCIEGCEECKMPGIDYDNLEQYSITKLQEILKYCEDHKLKGKLISNILNCVEGCEECKMPGIDYDNLEQYSVNKLKEILKYCEDHKLKGKLINDILDCIKGCEECKMPGIDYDNLEQYSVNKLKEILDYCKRHKISESKLQLISDLTDCLENCESPNGCKIDGLNYDNLEEWTESELKEALDYCKNQNKPNLIQSILDCIEGCEKCKMPGIDYNNLEQYSVSKLEEILDFCQTQNGDKYKKELIDKIMECIEKCKGHCKIPGIDYNHLEKYSVEKLKEILDYCKRNMKNNLIDLINDCLKQCQGSCKDITVDYDNLKNYSEKELLKILENCQNLTKPDMISSILDCLKLSNNKCKNKTIDYDNLEQYTNEQLSKINEDCEKSLKPLLINELKDCLNQCDKCKNLTISGNCCSSKKKCSIKKFDKNNLEQYSISSLKDLLEKCKSNSNYELNKTLNDFRPDFENMTPEQKAKYKTSRLLALNNVVNSQKNTYHNMIVSKILTNNYTEKEKEILKEEKAISSQKVMNQGNMIPNILIKPGSSFYGVLANNINTSVQGNIAIIEFKHGKLKGYKGIGQAAPTTDNEGVQIAINTLVTPEGDKLPTNAFAIDSDSYSSKFADEIDSKTLKVFALSAAGIILEAFGEAKALVETSGGEQSVNNGTVTTTSPQVDFNNMFAANISSKTGARLNTYIASELANSQTEVKVNRGKSLIIIFY